MIRLDEERPGGRSIFDNSKELEEQSNTNLEDTGGSGEPVETDTFGIQIKHDSNDLNKGTGIRI